MEISNYTDLIKQMPFNKMCYEKTRKITWECFQHNEVFGLFFNDVFKNTDTVRFSREELFEIVDRDEFNTAVFSIVFWGYPRGYTMGMNMKKLFQLFINNLPELKKGIQKNRNFSSDEFKEWYKIIVGNRKGIGLSTLSKFLYFFKVQIEGYRCLILDGRIESVIKESRFCELSRLKDKKKDELYFEYIKIAN